MLRNTPHVQDSPARIRPSRIAAGITALTTAAIIASAGGVAGAQTVSGHGYGGSNNTSHNSFTLHIENAYNSTINFVINLFN